jgi:hemolysin activation/secretion protein
VRDTPILAAAIPAEPSDLLNARDIEQGLENLKRAATADADIRIQASSAPDAGPGDSELIVRYVQPRILRATVSLDDSGTEATGRYQGSLTLSADNPLGLNDLFYLSLSHNLASQPNKRGTEGQTWHYSVPWGYWLFGLTASDSSYFQRIAGAHQEYVFGGASTNYEARLSRMIHRDQQRKLGAYLRGFQRTSSNRIDDTEIEVQRRKVGGWELGLTHREFLGRATIDATFAYRRGTGAFGAIAAPEELFGEGSSRFKLYIAELGLNAPFKLGEQKMRYSGLIRSQWNRTPLTPQDRFAIGSRYTVRGFDGETSLLGDRGMLIRSDIGWTKGESGAELYAGADYGQVGGKSAEQLQGDHLAGAVLGVRGNWSKLSYDFFAGAPIAKPQGYRTARVAAGFALSASF